MSTEKYLREIQVRRYYRDEGMKEEGDLVIKEIELEFYFKNRSMKRLIAIENDLDYLYSGFYIVNGVITINSNNYLIEQNKEKVYLKMKGYKQNTYQLPQYQPLRIENDSIFLLYEQFLNSSNIFKKTAGVHGASLFSSSYNQLYFAMDISRMNCLYKIIGFLSQNYNDIATPILFLSCRINIELIRTVDITGIKQVLTKATVSKKAIDFAKDKGIQLIGFIKPNRFTIFA